MKIVNMTPHDVTLILEDRKIVFERNANEKGYVENVPRVETRCTAVAEMNGVPVMRIKKEATNMPEVQKDTWYIVSYIIMDFFPDRSDLIAPDTSEGIKDDSGNILGVKRFIKYGKPKDFGGGVTIGDMVKKEKKERKD